MSTPGVYAQPRTITDLNDCYFYHTTDVPGYGLLEGEWDLRQGIRAYLGDVDFHGKRVLELGTASGFVCFHMEREGADVVGYDLSEHQSWDVVPYAQYSYEDFLQKRKEHIRRINNAFWLCHRAFGSHSTVVYGDVYSIPEGIGQVDISTSCSILLHVRDPFLALQKTLALTRETVIVTERAANLTPCVDCETSC
jgi:2-polyprenyl-3-methyl-5-hydroxy-6-metoxy-1,4-benzoquinol methylase